MSDTGTRPAVGKIRTDDEHADLLHFHARRIREQQALVEEAKGPVKVAKTRLKEQHDELATRFNEAKVDLGREYSRKYLEDLIAGGDVKMRDQVAFERLRARDKNMLGQAVFGVQPELFPGEETPAAARDEMAWRAEGYLRGLRGALEELQPGDPPEFHQAIMEAYRQGQKDTAERVARAMEAKAKQGQPDADQKPVDLNPPEPEPEAPEPGTPEAKRAERKSIDRAKESLGVKPTANRVPV